MMIFSKGNELNYHFYSCVYKNHMTGSMLTFAQKIVKTTDG